MDGGEVVALDLRAVTCHAVVMAEGPQAATRRRVTEHRRRLRSAGLRPVQIWVPDVHAPGFAEEAHRQSALAASSDHAADDQAFVDAISWFGNQDDE